MRRLLPLLVALLWGWGLAQVCEMELRAAIAGVSAPGEVAARLLAAAAQLVEPAYPNAGVGEPPLAGAGPATEAVRELHRRALLPPEWSVPNHDDDAWRSMLSGFAAPYRVEPGRVIGGDAEAMLAEMVVTLTRVSDSLRPLVIFTTGEEGRVVLFQVSHNWSPAPRQLFFRPPPDLRLASDRNGGDPALAVLAAMGNCALRLHYYLHAPAGQALEMLFSAPGTFLRIWASEPPLPDLPLRVPDERMTDALTFNWEPLAGVEVYSGAYDGPNVPPNRALAAILSVRRNVPLTEFIRALLPPGVRWPRRRRGHLPKRRLRC
jgi:hypothetical protein